MKSKRTLHQKLTITLCVVFFIAFLLIALFRTSFHAIDLAVNMWMPSIRSGTFTIVATGIDDYFDTNFLVLYSVLIAAVFFVKHRKQKGLLIIGALAGGALLVSIVKRIELVARPDNAIVVNPGYSFPSGHTVGIVIIAGVLVFFAWRYWNRASVKVGLVVLFSAVVGLVSFDRVYLNTHWFSDVFGSLLLGAFWLLFVVLLYRWLDSRGSFQGRRFNIIANWLYVGSAMLAVWIVLSGQVV